MMEAIKNYRWRKESDISREYALFELMDNDIPILDAGFSDDGKFEIAFNASIGGGGMALETLLKLLADGRALAERDRIA